MGVPVRRVPGDQLRDDGVFRVDPAIVEAQCVHAPRRSVAKFSP
jgi:hypothetical protein